MKQQLRVLRFLAIASGKYAWSSLKNCVKILLAQKPYRDEHALFFRQYVLHLTGLRRIRTITCVRHSGSEGAGSQAHMIMNAINFAQSSGLTYVHTPFAFIHHAERPMQQWVETWEGLFNLGAGEASCDPGNDDAVNYCYNWVDLELCFGWRNRREEQTHNFKAIIPEFRRKYYLNKSPRVTDEITVAVHIRRGDVSADDCDYAGTDAILKTLAQVKSILDTHAVKYSIRVYSQGNVADFADLSLLGVEFFLDTDAIWTMQELIEADILIMASGFFSYYAALISDGIKIFEPQEVSLTGRQFLPSWAWMYLSPAHDWLPCRLDGSIDQAAFNRQLSITCKGKLTQGT